MIKVFAVVGLENYMLFLTFSGSSQCANSVRKWEGTMTSLSNWHLPGSRQFWVRAVEASGEVWQAVSCNCMLTCGITAQGKSIRSVGFDFILSSRNHKDRNMSSGRYDLWPGGKQGGRERVCTHIYTRVITISCWNLTLISHPGKGDVDTLSPQVHCNHC